jgi:type IV pilus assembly protein PilO
MAAPLEAFLKWPARRKALVWLALSAVVILGYYFLGFQPRINALRSLEKQHGQLGRELRENQAIADNLPRVKEEVRRLDEKLALALEKLPDTEEIPNLLQTVSDLGKESGLEFLLFKPSPPVPKDVYDEVPLGLQIVGRSHALAGFFDKVGRLPRIVTNQNIDFGSTKPGPAGVKLKVSCRAVTFKFLEPGEQPKPEKQGKKKRGKS